MTVQGLPATGALVMGVGLVLTMVCFGAIGAVAAQLTEHSRSARGIAGAVIGVAFLLRAIGDSTPSVSFASWLSPIGWAQQARPFADERPAVLVIPLVVTAVLVSLAVVLESRRDLGAALLATRLGPARGSMDNVWTLVSRLQRGSLIGWAVGMAVAGLVLGAIASGVLDLLKETPNATEILRKMGGQGGLVGTYLAAIVPLLAAVGALLGVSAMARAASEENAARGELVLSTAVSRRGLLGSHLIWALGGAVVLMLVTGVSMGLGYLAVGGGGDQVARLAGATLAQVPAMWVVIAVAALAVGLSPRLAAVGWAADGLCLLIAWIFPLLSVPDAVMDVSPFRHVPQLPGGSMHWPPLVVLTLIAAVLVVASLIAYRRRDTA